MRKFIYHTVGQAQSQDKLIYEDKQHRTSRMLCKCTGRRKVSVYFDY